LAASRSHAVMNDRTVQTTVSNPKRRLRFGMRSLIGIVLFLGLAFGWLARMQRQVAEQDALVAELARDRVVVNSQVPTWLCLAFNLPFDPGRSSKWLSWLSPSWFSRPDGFNAGTLLRDEEVPRVVERLQRLGDVYEVQYHGGSLDGLRLFCIGKIHYPWGPERDTCTFKAYPVSGATSGSFRSEHP
jgi:hypothetical protein